MEEEEGKRKNVDKGERRKEVEDEKDETDETDEKEKEEKKEKDKEDEEEREEEHGQEDADARRVSVPQVLYPPASLTVSAPCLATWVCPKSLCPGRRRL